MVVEFGDNFQFNKDRILEGDDEIFKICFGFFEFDKNSNVRIVYYLVQEYFELDRIIGLLVLQFYVER